MINGSSILEQTAPTVLIGRAEVLRRTGLKKSTMYNLIKAGTFPEPVRKSAGGVAWIEAEVEGWIRDRAALRAHKSTWNEATIPMRSLPTATQHVFPPDQLQAPKTDQRAESNAQLIKKLTGGTAFQMQAFAPKLRYDSETGEFWQCIMKVELPNSGSDQKKRR